MFPIQCFSLTELRQTKLDPGIPSHLELKIYLTIIYNTTQI